MTMQCEIDDFEVWETCEECGGTGTTDKAHPFPEDPEFIEERRCEDCGGSGRILKAYGERQ